MFKEIKKCRICGNTNLVSILDLGNQYLTGVFPKSREQQIPAGPLELVKCVEDGTDKTCGLLQLRYSFNPDEMYGENYSYRSGVNQTMTLHLQAIVQNILNFIHLSPGALVVDIGSNDATLLKAYPHDNITLVGIDPSGAKFRKYYPEYIKLINDYFSASTFRAVYGDRKAKIVTAIAMFYDLESPLKFMQDIKEILAEDGVAVFEQSYMPTMLALNAYDTICHEHLEYYGLRQIKWMTDRIGFKILGAELNDINGGSFCVTIAKQNSTYEPSFRLIQALLQQEKNKGLDMLKPYSDFKDRVFRHREELIKFFKEAKRANQTILGYGASTKGNVVLQFCGFDETDIPAIADRNPDKHGCFTPGTMIPIISEEEARRRKPDYLLPLPWHFKDEFVQREKQYLEGGGKFLFHLPNIEVISK